MTKLIKLKEDEIIIHEGSQSNSMYWVQAGQLVVVKKRGTEEVFLGHIQSGELVGEMSFLDGGYRSATVKALTDCDLIEIPKETIDAVFSSQPKWLEVLVKTLAERLRKTNARISV